MDSLEERRVAAQEKMAEAALIQAKIAEKRLELAHLEREDRKTLTEGLKQVLSGVSNYFSAMSQVELTAAASRFGKVIELPTAQRADNAG